MFCDLVLGWIDPAEVFANEIDCVNLCTSPSLICYKLPVAATSQIVGRFHDCSPGTGNGSHSIFRKIQKYKKIYLTREGCAGGTWGFISASFASALYATSWQSSTATIYRSPSFSFSLSHSYCSPFP